MPTHWPINGETSTKKQSFDAGEKFGAWHASGPVTNAQLELNKTRASSLTLYCAG